MSNLLTQAPLQVLPSLAIAKRINQYDEKLYGLTRRSR